MIPSSVSLVGGSGNRGGSSAPRFVGQSEQASSSSSSSATVAKDSSNNPNTSKNRIATSATTATGAATSSTTVFDGTNQNVLSSSAVLASTYSSDGLVGRLANSVGNSVSIQKSYASMVSFNSSSDEGPDASRSHDGLGNKVDVVYSLLSMLSSHDRLQSSQMLLSISQDRDNCQLIRHSGCMALLIQLLHPSDAVPLPPPTGDELEVIRRASEALKNLVRFDDDEQRQRRESIILLMLEHVREYVLHLRLVLAGAAAYQSKCCEQAYAAIATLMKLSYNEEQRLSTCALGGLHCIVEALILDQKILSENCPPMNLDFRRFIGMTLTNLTYGASETKRILCSSNQFLEALNAQISSQPEELRQVFAGVLRNLSWKTDASSKSALREAGTVVALMRAAMEAQKEPTLKSILSALWNLSAHCSENKAKICAVSNALEFLISTLVYKSPTGSTAVVESGGGILRNVSSHISLNEEYRAIVRQHNCFEILLEHLQSTSLTIVSNACGTLWNLSAHSVVDQRALCQMGAEKKLRDLVHSKHKIIQLGSSATLKNLLASRSKGDNTKGGGSSNSSVASMSAEQKRNHNLMKLRQHQSTMDKPGDDSQIFLASSSRHESPLAMRSITDHQPTDCAFASGPSPQRRQMPAAVEVAAILNDVTRPVLLKSSTPPFRIPGMAANKHIDQRMTSSHVMNDSSAKNNAEHVIPHRMHSSTISTAYSLPSSKEERIQYDRAAVHRYHNSLRRSSQPQTTSTMVNDDRRMGFASLDYGDDPSMSLQGYDPYSDQSAAASRFVQGPMKNVPFIPAPFNNDSKVGSPEKNIVGGIHMQQQRMPFNRKPSGPGTPAEFKSEPSSRGSKSVNALTPLVFSRQSSLESLESCDQYSVRSTVYSEYSALPTNLPSPSPSELPDSPTNTMPPPMTAERKAMIVTHQQRCAYMMDDRRVSEPNSVSGEPLDAAASAMVAGYPSYASDAGPSTRNNNVDDEKMQSEQDDEERPRIFAKPTTEEQDHDDEKPKIFGKQRAAAHGEFESNKLSASSSLSALTIDSDAKPKEADLRMGFPNGGQGIFVFPSGGAHEKLTTTMENEELQACILSARPTPKSNDNSFKIPRPPFPSNSKPFNHRTIPSKSLIPTASGHGGEPQKSTATTNQGTEESELRHVMQSAMPKPKAARSKPPNSNVRVISPNRRGNNNVSVVKPIIRSLPSSTADQRPSSTGSDQRPSNETNHATTSTSASSQITNSQRGNASSELADVGVAKEDDAGKPQQQRRSEDVMEKSEEILHCISLALPKPKSTTRKSKSLDRKSQRRDLAVAFTNSMESGSKRGEALLSNSGGGGGQGDGPSTSTTSGTVIIPNEQQDDPKALLLLSCSSALMSSVATAERVKDATILFDTSSSSPIGGIRSPPVARIAPKLQCTNNSTNQTIATSPLPTVSTYTKDRQPSKSEDSTKHQSTTISTTNNENNMDDSLSEDNYSQIYDESFNLDPEDLDLDSMKEEEDGWIRGANDACADMSMMTAALADQLPSPTELLIECDGFTGLLSKDAREVENGRPKISKAPPPPPPPRKAVKGGQRPAVPPKLASTLAAPKVSVRTTKATELRAKKTLQQSPSSSTVGNKPDQLRVADNPRSRSMSPAVAPSSPSPSAQRRSGGESIGKISPSSNRSRNISGSSLRSTDSHHQLQLAKDGTQKVDDAQQQQQSRKSPNSVRLQQQQQSLGSAKSKRELGSNVRKKIESLQKRESASEDDNSTTAASPIVGRKANTSGSIVSKGKSANSPPQPTAKPGRTDSNGQSDGKRALVTTV